MYPFGLRSGLVFGQLGKTALCSLCIRVMRVGKKLTVNLQCYAITIVKKERHWGTVIRYKKPLRKLEVYAAEHYYTRSQVRIEFE